MKHLRNISRLISTFLSLVLVILALYTLVGAWHEKRTGEAFFVLGYKPVYVLSNSMKPTMPKGSIALVRKASGETPETGDIVMFRTDLFGTPAYVTHRIIGQEAGGYLTKGDNNAAADPAPLDAAHICGEVVFIWNPFKQTS